MRIEILNRVVEEKLKTDAFYVYITVENNVSQEIFSFPGFQNNESELELLESLISTLQRLPIGRSGSMSESYARNVATFEPWFQNDVFSDTRNRWQTEYKPKNEEEAEEIAALASRVTQFLGNDEVYWPLADPDSFGDWHNEAEFESFEVIYVNASGVKYNTRITA